MDIKTKSHWEEIYKKKMPNEVSWTQETPQTSIDFLVSFNLPKKAAIIDVGAGESKFVDYLLSKGYENITVLDISKNAVDKAKRRIERTFKNEESDFALRCGREDRRFCDV